ELVALRVGHEIGAQLSFIDLDYSDQILAEHAADKTATKPRIESLMEESHLQRSQYLHSLAQRVGCRDFNEMWDHLFEANFESRSTESFSRELAGYCFFARRDAPSELLSSDGTVAREQSMAHAIAEELSQNQTGRPLLVVTG